ncbi:MAG: hypothetical protein KKH12_16230 [Gammaproteobacteria bacterium]|nr:hypothetical protein [Gammaproteobacteria bacterium]
MSDYFCMWIEGYRARHGDAAADALESACVELGDKIASAHADLCAKFPMLDVFDGHLLMSLACAINDLELEGEEALEAAIAYEESALEAEQHPRRRPMQWLMNKRS